MKLMRLHDKQWVNVEQIATVAVVYRAGGADAHAQVVIRMVGGGEVPASKVVPTADAITAAEELVEEIRQIAMGWKQP